MLTHIHFAKISSNGHKGGAQEVRPRMDDSPSEEMSPWSVDTAKAWWTETETPSRVIQHTQKGDGTGTSFSLNRIPLKNKKQKATLHFVDTGDGH